MKRPLSRKLPNEKRQRQQLNTLARAPKRITQRELENSLVGRMMSTRRVRRVVASVSIGSLVALINENDNPSKTEDEYKAISGSWMVASIQHLVSTPSLYYMILTLVRDSNYFDPNDIQSPEAPFR